MALVFISHAHGDEALTRRIINLLRDALNLEPTDFFASSQVGRGVAPAGNIRDEILRTLNEAKALVVLVTPKSAGSPWVWLEAGHRLGRVDCPNPVFLLPSQRFVPLLQPVADLRSLCLDKDDDLLELVKSVGAGLGRPEQDVLAYREALTDLAQSTAAAYSPSAEQRARVVQWLRANAAVLLLAAALPVAAWYYSAARVGEVGRAAAAEAQRRIAELEAALTNANDVVNDEVTRTAARYLVLKGIVMSGPQPVANAQVRASASATSSGECAAPDCTSDLTTTAGEFVLDLTKIRAQNGDDIRLSVTAEGFKLFSKLVRVDVRAMDVAVPAQSVDLEPSRIPIGPQP
jgi:TIR domain